MKKFIYIVSILTFCCFTFWCCQKRPFAHVEITGRVVNFWDKSPVSSQIQLWVGGGTPGENGTTQFGTYSTNSDGSFDIKSNAQWSGNDYTLLIMPNVDEGSTVSVGCTVAKHKSVDVGDITTGDFTFNCKMTLHSVSGASITFLGGGTPQTTFSAGTNTVITVVSTRSFDYQQIMGNFYPITYSLSTGARDSTVFAPLHQPTDTTSITINY